MKFITWLKSLFTHPEKENASMSKIALSLGIPAGVVVDGTTVNTLTVTVTDDTDAALSAQNLTLAADAGVTLSDTALTTDANGQATASLTSAAAGTYKVTATLADGTAQSISVPFLAAAQSGAGAVGGTTASSEDSPLAKVKAEFGVFVEFVERGIELFGKEAEADLVALKDKFL